MIFWKRVQQAINKLWYPRSVTIGKRFRYTTTAAGNGVPTKEEVSSDQITGLRVQFTPDRVRNMEGGYTRALIADEGIAFMEWLGKESDETQVPEEPDDSGEDGGL